METTDGETAHRASRRVRVLVAIGVGIVTAVVSALRLSGHSHQTQVGDLTPLYVGAQALRSGADPYSTVAVAPAVAAMWLAYKSTCEGS
jgi:hypothetical protein